MHVAAQQAHTLCITLYLYRGTVGIERRWAFGSRTQLPEAKVTVNATVASNSIPPLPTPTPPFEFKPPTLQLNMKLEITAIAALRDGF